MNWKILKFPAFVNAQKSRNVFDHNWNSHKVGYCLNKMWCVTFWTLIQSMIACSIIYNHNVHNVRLPSVNLPINHRYTKSKHRTSIVGQVFAFDSTLLNGVMSRNYLRFGGGRTNRLLVSGLLRFCLHHMICSLCLANLSDWHRYVLTIHSEGAP